MVGFERVYTPSNSRARKWTLRLAAPPKRNGLDAATARPDQAPSSPGAAAGLGTDGASFFFTGDFAGGGRRLRRPSGSPSSSVRRSPPAIVRVMVLPTCSSAFRPSAWAWTTGRGRDQAGRGRHRARPRPELPAALAPEERDRATFTEDGEAPFVFRGERMRRTLGWERSSLVGRGPAWPSTRVAGPAAAAGEDDLQPPLRPRARRSGAGYKAITVPPGDSKPCPLSVSYCRTRSIQYVAAAV